MVDLMERLEVLLKQEEEHYGCSDYLSPVVQQQLARDSPPELESLSSDDEEESVDSSSSSPAYTGINEHCREKICQWAYQVVDHFDFSRETVAISMSLLDRYLSTTGSVSKKHLVLSAMTTMYLTIKLFEKDTISMSFMVELSRGSFMVEQMAEMEIIILQKLSWRVHQPTQFCFARHFLHLLPRKSCPPSVRHDILELARFLTELSVCDYFFAPRKGSFVALAALLNAIEMLQAGITFPALYGIFKKLRVRLKVDANSPEIKECRIRLQELYTEGGCVESQKAPDKKKKRKTSFWS